jgi:hypothetical protein
VRLLALHLQPQRSWKSTSRLPSLQAQFIETMISGDSSKFKFCQHHLIMESNFFNLSNRLYSTIQDLRKAKIRLQADYFEVSFTEDSMEICAA